MPNSRHKLIARHALLSICFVALYVLLTSPHAIVIYHFGTVVWYPAVGLAVALLLGISPWYAPLIAFCGMLVGVSIYHEPFRSFGLTFGTLGFALAYTGAACGLRGPWRIDFRLHHRRDVVRYICVAFGAAAVNTIIGSACLAADRCIAWRDYWPAALIWFLGDGIGLVGVAPFFLVHVLPAIHRWLFPQPEQRDKSTEPWRHGFKTYTVFEACSQYLGIALLVWLMFGLSWGRYQTFFLAFVPIIWIAMRQGIRRVVVGTLLLNFSIVVAMDFAPPPVTLLSTISLLMLVVSSAGLVVGSEVSERNRVARDLHEQTSYLNALIENSPLGIVVFNEQGRVEFANPAFEKLVLYKQRDLTIGDIATLWLEGMASALPKALSGETSHQTVRQKRKDGKALDLALHAVPLKVKGRVRGVYAIYEDISEQVRASEAERRYAESQSQLVKELQVRTRQITLLNEMGSRLQSCGSVQEASNVIAQSAHKLFPAALSGTLYLLQSSRKTLEAAVHFGADGYSETSFRLDSCASLRRAHANWNDLRDPTVTCYHLRQNPSEWSLCVPIAAQEDTFGVLHLEFPETQQGLHDTELIHLRENWQNLAVTAAAEVALSLAAIRLRENLQEQAIRDPLTRLYNRRFLEESLERELQRAARGHYPLSLLFLDLDHFKRFNDNFGHAAGDVVLQSLAILLRSFFRSTDVCCRAGGEEFAVILPEAAPENAIVRANALRLEVKSMALVHDDKALGRVTVSIGVACFPDHATTPPQLLQVADKCLYASKAHGRDMATLAATHASRAHSSI